MEADSGGVIITFNHGGVRGVGYYLRFSRITKAVVTPQFVLLRGGFGGVIIFTQGVRGVGYYLRFSRIT